MRPSTAEELERVGQARYWKDSLVGLCGDGDSVWLLVRDSQVLHRVLESLLLTTLILLRRLLFGRRTLILVVRRLVLEVQLGEQSELSGQCDACQDSQDRRSP